jgi:menaquinone-dependent protoporphyrinogen oxidase
MPHILVLYASKHGHTEKIASRVAQAAEREGVEVDLRPGADAAQLQPSAYDAVVVGASIHAGKHQSEIVHWARSHATTLHAMPSAFFSVCLTAAEDTDESRTATRKYVDEFLEQTGWTPTRTTTFAGALQYREYDFATRLVIRLMMKHAGHPTDTSHDYDYTDWDAVEQFGHDCAAMVTESRSTPAR